MITSSANEVSSVKIARLITRMNVGGPALHVLTLAEGLSSLGYRHLLISGTCQPEEGDTDAPNFARPTIAFIPTLARSISPIKDLVALWSTYRLLRREHPLIVHTHTAKAGIVGRLAGFLAGVPIIIHTFHGNSLTGYFPPVTSALFRAIERLLARVTDRICVVSAQQRNELCERLNIAGPDKFAVIPLGLNLTKELCCPPPALRAEVLTVGWLGRLVDVKGVPLLIEIIQEAARRNASIRFLVGGDGPDRPLIREVLARCGTDRVEWSGWRHDIPEFLSSCDLLLQTSRNEGTPVALIQGMAAGRAFVSTAVGGVVDLVDGVGQRNGEGCRWFANGVLADPDPAAFVGALQSFQSNRSALHSMGQAARAFAAQRFQAERLVRDIDLLYRELLTQGVVTNQVSNGSQTVRMTMGDL